MKRTGRLIVVIAAALCVITASACGGELPKRLLTDEIAKLGPGPADNNFDFVVMGDTRDGDAMFEYMIDLAEQMNPDFILDVGDLVHDGGTDAQYQHYFDQIADAGVPFFSVIGNHENEAPGGLERYKAMFGSPDFYFDYGNSRFIALDNSAASYDISEEQFEWLEGALDTDRVKFVFMHAPPKTHLWQASMKREASERFVRLMEKHGVRKVYFGHVHAFDKLTRGVTDYVMTGCAGAEPDPVSEFYHPLSGGFYHLMLVQVRGDIVMDVQVRPDTADIYSFPNAEGLPIETPYVSYRHYNAPAINAFEVDTSVAADAPLPVLVKASSHPKALEVGLTEVTASCADAAGNVTGPVALEAEPFDERLWRGELPPIAARPLDCSVIAQDSVHSRTMNLYGIPERLRGADGSISMRDVPFTVISEDRDEPTAQLADDLDIRNVSMAYDDTYVYLKIELDAPMKEGDAENREIHLIGGALLSDKLEIVPDVKKMLTAIPMIVYAPLAPTMGFPDCGFYDLSGYDKGNFKVTGKGISCKMMGPNLYIRAEKKGLKIDDATGVKMIAASGKLVLKGKPAAYIGDTSDIAYVLFGNVAGGAELYPPLVPYEDESNYESE